MPQDDHDLTHPGGLTRLYVENPLSAGADIALGEAQTHFLAHVLRATAGDALRVFNGRDGEWRATVKSVAKRAVTLTLDRQTREQAGVPDLWLVLAPIKKTPLDYIVQKATELGIARLQPVITRRTIVERVNLDRMRANAIEAAEQSERLSVPDIAEPCDLTKLLSAWNPERQLMFCDEAAAAGGAVAVLAKTTPSPWAILTGPEGGFDPAEREMLRRQSFVVPVSLGPRIMRADTAALAALAIWQSTLGDWN
ncbi:MAG: 16S rRNA (uracil(1498)-N(3))-methyltransferase [Alphaproteobacteria bacterium]|nr:16S rRNA (uracil(1498)-N(3))-methyltransferase [Alphaproteobacteria bacterium]